MPTPRRPRRPDPGVAMERHDVQEHLGQRHGVYRIFMRHSVGQQIMYPAPGHVPAAPTGADGSCPAAAEPLCSHGQGMACDPAGQLLPKCGGERICPSRSHSKAGDFSLPAFKSLHITMYESF